MKLGGIPPSGEVQQASAVLTETHMSTDVLSATVPAPADGAAALAVTQLLEFASDEIPEQPTPHDVGLDMADQLPCPRDATTPGDDAKGTPAENGVLFASDDEPPMDSMSNPAPETDDDEAWQTAVQDVYSRKEGSQDLDLLRVYYDQVKRTPLLRAEQEVELARAIEVGVFAQAKLEAQDYGSATDDYDPHNPIHRKQRIADLEHLTREGAAAFDHLVAANLRLVVNIAMRYRGRGVSLFDLIQEGNIDGLLRAVEKFDPDKGFKFSTYATWWIRQAITRAIANQGRVIRLPIERHEEVAKVKHLRRDLTDVLGRQPTIDELAERLDMPAGKVCELITDGAPTISLETSLARDNDDATLHTIIGHPDARAIEDIAIEAQQHQLLGEALRVLSDRERIIVARHFWGGRSLVKVAAELGLSSKTVYHIKDTTLAKLQHPALGLQERLGGDSETDDASWGLNKACGSVDVDVFFTRKQEEQRALSICQTCPVREACLAHALDRKIKQGVWGGTNGMQRAEMRKQLKQKEAAAQVQQDADQPQSA